ncbi:CRP-like cAMP-binding protein [Algoriphagus sp. 4150]|uniref:Crp/Fnr family transcriptional regulator n=1 Tax=Algoriphagus sp. 4150 TaxID=2817756 RepID=UPI00285C84BE|nr:Crp/Fnr family transcriptional regulator [Algoriphagus sp. 4150]MDR7129783.1 CRP-like cAMP-binding protein [Algoriphagus sp. 4150]
MQNNPTTVHRQLIHTLRMANISDDVANELARNFQVVSKRNNILLSKGKIANHVFFIDSGYVILESEINGNSFTRHIAKPGEFITVIESFTSRQPSKETLKMTKGAIIYAMGHTDFILFSERYPELERAFGKVLQDTLISCQARINDLLSLSAEAYYEKLISETPYILQAVPQYELSSYLGIKPQSLSRIRKKLADVS